MNSYLCFILFCRNLPSLDHVSSEDSQFDGILRLFPHMNRVKGYNVIGRTKRMGYGIGMWWMGLYKDGISGATRRTSKVGALF